MNYSKLCHDLQAWFPLHRYCLWLLYLPAYLLYFGILELFPPTEVHLIECPLDSLIPQIPAFFIPYALWWGLFPGALVWALFKDTKEQFLKLSFVLFGGYTVCLIVYTVYPNGIQIREELTGHDLFSFALRVLRSLDPPINVCPSMHVSSTVAIMFSGLRTKTLKLRGKCILSLVSVLIILATLFIKQHSVIDVLLGILLSLVLMMIWRLFMAGSKKL